MITDHDPVQSPSVVAEVRLIFSDCDLSPFSAQPIPCTALNPTNQDKEQQAVHIVIPEEHLL